MEYQEKTGELIPVYNNSEKGEDDESLDYLKVLEAIRELPFFVGKNLLVDFLKGKSSKRVRTSNLDALKTHGALDKYNNEEILGMIENLIKNNHIEIIRSSTNNFLKILKITDIGKKEIFNPQLNKKKLKNKFNFDSKTIISDEDILKFKELDSYLNGFNDNQKKAIISESEKILCIAGAGSGKTLALTRRIEFLVKYRSISSDKILAITFTRKARKEMQERLSKLNIQTNVETFNSFCEKILRQHSDKIYGRNINVITYGNKVMALMSALHSQSLTMDQALENYFSSAQRRNKTKEVLSNIFLNDCFSVLDYFKVKKQDISDFSEFIGPEKFQTAKMIYNISKNLKEHMKLQGLRDFTDQILDTIDFFKNHKEFIPNYEHILVDEYQDVNAMQIELIDLLNSKNLFCVGDPRQSIFGWRGSDINYILSFKDKFQDSEIVTLIKNYRSNNHIVDLINLSIKDMNLPDLQSNFQDSKEIKLIRFESEELEYKFVVNKILSYLNSGIPPNEIFILARTNRQLEEVSRLMKQKNIKHVVRSDELKRPVFAGREDTTLATIHSIKGLEAELVFVIGCNDLNFPCKASDHPVIELVKIEDYDKEEEEKRIFYVALSRAKNKLYLTYTGKKPTYFINKEMLDVIEE